MVSPDLLLAVALQINEKEIKTMKENAFILCQRLLKLVQTTRAGADVIDIEYFGNDKTDDAHVDITCASGYTKRVDVTGDSGIAMIKDVLKHIK